MLAALVKRISGQEVMDYLEQRLFKPLGLRDARFWLRDPSGCCQGGTGLCMSLRDMHRIACCLLAGGEQLVPAWYLTEMTKKQIETVQRQAEEEKYGYGWQCWRTRAGWSLYGMGGQLSILCPDKQTVLSTIADTRLDPFGVQRIYNAFFDEIWPFLPGDGGIPEGTPDQPLILSLSVPGLKDCPAAGFLGKGCYVFPGSNSLGLKALTLSDTELKMSRTTCSVSLPYARGKTLEIPWPGYSDIPALVSAGWIEDRVLRLRCHAVGNAPCGFDMLISLSKDRITVQSRCSSDPLTIGYDGIASGFLQKGDCQ